VPRLPEQDYPILKGLSRRSGHKRRTQLAFSQIAKVLLHDATDWDCCMVCKTSAFRTVPMGCLQ